MKLQSIVASIAILVSFAAYANDEQSLENNQNLAQFDISSDTTTDIPAPALQVTAPAAPSALTLSPSIKTGAYTLFTGQVAGKIRNADKRRAQNVGAFINPNLSINYKESKFSASVMWDAELVSFAGFGKDSNVTMQDSFYFHHIPEIKAEGNLGGGWKLGVNALADVFHARNAGDSAIDYVVLPTLTYAFNDAFSLSAGYRYQRSDSLDSSADISFEKMTADEVKSLKDAIAKDSKSKVGIPRDENGNYLKAVSSASEPTNWHAGMLKASLKLGKNVSLYSLGLAGRVVSTDAAAQANQYRIQSGVSLSDLGGFTIALAHRYQLSDKDTGSNSSYNRIYANLEYALSDNVSLALDNTSTMKRAKANEALVYEIETYAGVGFSF